MSAEDSVFSSIRRSLGITGQEASRRLNVEERLERSPRGLVPDLALIPQAELIARFTAKAEAAQASVQHLPSLHDAPAAIAALLSQWNAPATIRVAPDERLKALPWNQTTLEIAYGKPAPQDETGLSLAFAGVAETGTLALVSGPSSPSTLAFLPENHIVILKAADLVACYEDSFAKLRFAFGKGNMPRTLHWITGPSRSADIEQTLLLGAHGPKRLHCLLVDDTV